MKINIVCNDTGWIYDQFFDAFKKYSKHTILRNSKEPCDITHYIPYYEVPKKPQLPNSKITAWFSHQELKDPLKTKFISAAHLVDCAISHSNKYAQILKQNKVQNVTQIMPGVDLTKFLPKGSFKNNKKLVVGYVGRQYTSSSRKNPTLLKEISKLDFVDFRTTGGNLDLDSIPNFYWDLDLVISPATVEGGPMAVLEALAVGVPILCFDGVGVANEFSDGVIRVKGDNKDYIEKLKEIWENKIHKTWHNDNVVKKTRMQVEQFTWQNFVRKHEKVWEKL